ncbi:MAG: oxygen-independent coproporphyrinogen III oxidase [Gammaproteobacteria bacterium]|nr:oxygen-independent coproporphyrinogen III oxidase [Gammaproteobacteria bacterium]
MDQTLVFDVDLIRRYDKSGPRYTSYPTAVQFHSGFAAAEYRAQAERSTRERPQGPLSLYFHIPFCDTVCFYCGCNKIVTKNRARTLPYLEHLCKEIALQGALYGRERPVTQLHWGGGTPTFLNQEQMRGLMAATRTHFKLLDNDEGEYSIEIDPREAEPSTIALLRELGFNRLSMGVQDFDPKVQQAVNRIQSEEQTFLILNAAREQGFKSISLDLIYGLPHQSVQSFAQTLEKVIAAGPDRLSVFNYAHMPELFKTQRQINAEDLPSAAEKLAILQYTIERLNRAGYVYIGMDHFAKPHDELAVAQREGTLYRNFQGYSTHAECDLVGLGVTSIGMVGDCYAQNSREIDDYYARLDQGQLPILRGVELSADDKLRREVITQLICHFELNYAKINAQFGIAFNDYFAAEREELRILETDGLIRLDERGIYVLPAGRLLIRNVCMVFDRYLREQKGQRFSKVI